MIMFIWWTNSKDNNKKLYLQVNDWQQDWVNFFARQRIQPQMDLIEKNSGDREARELWAQLQVMISMEIWNGILIIRYLQNNVISMLLYWCETMGLLLKLINESSFTYQLS